MPPSAMAASCQTSVQAMGWLISEYACLMAAAASMNALCTHFDDVFT